MLLKNALVCLVFYFWKHHVYPSSTYVKEMAFLVWFFKYYVVLYSKKSSAIIAKWTTQKIFIKKLKFLNKLVRRIIDSLIKRFLLSTKCTNNILKVFIIQVLITTSSRIFFSQTPSSTIFAFMIQTDFFLFDLSNLRFLKFFLQIIKL